MKIFKPATNNFTLKDLQEQWLKDGFESHDPSRIEMNEEQYKQYLFLLWTEREAKNLRYKGVEVVYVR